MADAEALDPAVVERAARAVFPYVRCDACRIAPHSPCMDCADRSHNAAWSALAAARSGEPAAPTVSAEQVARAAAKERVASLAADAGCDPEWLVEQVLTALRIEVTP